MEKTYTLENFKVNDYAWKPIESEGRWSEYSARWDVNYSSILSRLIVEAGKFCEDHSSDLFISWSMIEKELHDMNYCGGVYLFGFRQYGVDHSEFVLNRYDNYGKFAKYEYRSLWKLEIMIKNDEITMKLGRCF